MIFTRVTSKTENGRKISKFIALLILQFIFLLFNAILHKFSIFKNLLM